jgi:hypothetical protein
VSMEAENSVGLVEEEQEEKAKELQWGGFGGAGDKWMPLRRLRSRSLNRTVSDWLPAARLTSHQVEGKKWLLLSRWHSQINNLHSIHSVCLETFSASLSILSLSIFFSLPFLYLSSRQGLPHTRFHFSLPGLFF